ncbi:histidine kinase [Qipengyuania marisflavi]|uniref:histidine kinase n=2 Tax=Qipengyuania marisflavi TaxID=2486356 RepID=A0A5S3P0C1_9SPHN|nr:histidine kinase [Qipengyuania marisflavi]
MLSVFAIEEGERRRETADLNRHSQAMASAIERRAFTSSSYLRAGAALFTTQEKIDADLFRRFVSELRLDSDYRGAEGIGWAPVISANDLPAFETRLQSEWIDDAKVRPSLSEAPRSQLTPILFLQPDTLRNRRALGYDMYSDPVRRAAMDEALRSMRPSASGRIVLVQEGSEKQGDAGFLIYMPVFDGAGGQRRLKGFIYSPFNAPQFIEAAAALVNSEGMAAELYDLNDGKRTLLAGINPVGEQGEMVEREVNLANRPMMLVVRSGQAQTLSSMSMVTLLFGIAVASLLMLVARLLTQQALEDRRSINWFAEQNSIRDSLTRELNHRVKNTLANVLSILSLTRRRAVSLDEFAEGLDGRIRSLSGTHDLLTQSEWGTTPIRSVIEAELASYADDADHTVSMSGPEVELAPNDALSLGLALHELTANAAKFGSLSRPGGTVTISWERTSEALARVDWVESGGPTVGAPSKRGFGTDLIEKIVAHELRHPVEISFDPEGVRCSLLLPIRERSEFELRKANPAAHAH